MTGTELGSIAFTMIQNDFHRPMVNGKCNRTNIEEQITIGMYAGALGPMTDKDVEFICDFIDDLTAEYGNVK